jgi:hypothetical protein
MQEFVLSLDNGLMHTLKSCGNFPPLTTLKLTVPTAGAETLDSSKPSSDGASAVTDITVGRRAGFVLAKAPGSGARSVRQDPAKASSNHLYPTFFHESSFPRRP